MDEHRETINFEVFDKVGLTYKDMKNMDIKKNKAKKHYKNLDELIRATKKRSKKSK